MTCDLDALVRHALERANQQCLVVFQTYQDAWLAMGDVCIGTRPPRVNRSHYRVHYDNGSTITFLGVHDLRKRIAGSRYQAVADLSFEPETEDELRLVLDEERQP
jgi:hypothetical protein